MTRIIRTANSLVLGIFLASAGCGPTSTMSRSDGSATQNATTIEEFKEAIKNGAREGTASLEITSMAELESLVDSSLNSQNIDLKNIADQIKKVMDNTPDEYAHVLPAILVDFLRPRGVEPSEVLTWLAQHMAEHSETFVSECMSGVVDQIRENQVSSKEALAIKEAFQQNMGDDASAFGDIVGAIDDYASGVQEPLAITGGDTALSISALSELQVIVGVEPPFLDSDGDGIPDALDQCPGYPEIIGTWYADADHDGLVVPSPGNQCQDDQFHLAAGDLSTYQLANFDSDDGTATLTWNATPITEAAYGADLNGDGDATDSTSYFVISNPHQFRNFANNCGSGDSASCSSNILIVADLDFSDLDGTGNDTVTGDGAYTTTAETDMINGDSSESTLYTGILNGGNRTLVNFHIDRTTSSNTGLIANSGIGAKILDLNFGTADAPNRISGLGTVGLLAIANSDIVIRNVHVYGNIRGWGGVGALIGIVGPGVAAEITGSSAHGIVSGSFLTGGLIGKVPAAITMNGVAYPSATVSITESFNAANVTDLGQYAGTNKGFGGLVGQIEGSGSSFTRSYNQGSVTGEGGVGGITTMYFTQTATFTDVYNAGNITSTGTDEVAGIVGGPTWAIHDRHYTNVYNVGTITSGDIAKACAIEDDNDQNLPTGNTMYYLTQAGASCTSPGVTKSQAEMQLEATFIGFDFVNVWGIQPGGYPYLRSVTP